MSSNKEPNTYQHLNLTELETGIYQLSINRPKVLNALNLECLNELNACLDTLEKEANLRVLLITGTGDKAFVAGADITYMSELSSQQAYEFSQYGNQTFSRINQLKVPVIALVNGYALGGGCELALSCDFILAADNACFAQPEVNLGILPGFGGSQRLARKIGLSQAMELIMTGRNVKSDEALQLGLINQCHPADALSQAGLEMARRLIHKSPDALTAIKRVMHQGFNMPLEHALPLESHTFALAFASYNRHLAMQAFLNKSPISFKPDNETSD